MNIKHKFKEITPPFIWRWLRNRIIKKRQAEKKYDPRRWWYGEDLLGDNSRFKEIFYFEKLQSSICMLNNEIRDCIEVEPSKSLKLDFLNFDESKDILFSFGNKSHDRSVNGKYEIFLDNQKKIEIKEPLSNRWNNSYLKSGSKFKELQINNKTSHKLYFTCPIFLQKYDYTNKDIKNILLIVLDQLDYKALNELEKNPNDLKFINNFFSDEINYENCFSAAEWTLPCFSSIFSGKHPSIHGNFDLKVSQKIKNVITNNNMINFLRNEGFSTFGISKSKGHHAGYNFQKDFDRLLYYDDALDQTVEDDYNFAKKAIEQLEMNQGGKNFMYLHYMSSHAPYWKPGVNEEVKLDSHRFGDPLKEYNDAINDYGDSKVEPIMNSEKVKNIIKRQKERIKSLDLVLGQLFSYIEKTDIKKNTIVIFTADHGPNHFGKSKQPMMNRPRLNVPLKIYDFNNIGKKKINDYVCQTDIFPLIKNFLNKENAKNVIPPYGQNILPVISESIFNDKYKVSIRTKNHTFYYTCKFDPENFNIMINEVFDNRIENNEKIVSEDESELKTYYFKLLEKHLEKSEIIKIVR
jgi:phosphoglycerol transferase MdoB-like AlkP superfamily enzyme